MIIYGSHLYFKRDSSYHRATCPGCGRAGELYSYTARRWYHIYFIPIIPAAYVRVIDECPACGNGLELYLDDWESLGDAELESSLEDIRTGDVDREQAQSTLYMLRLAGDERRFATAAARILKLFPDDTAILAQLAQSFAYFGLDAESKRTISRLLELNPDRETQDSVETLAAPSEVRQTTRPSRLVDRFPWKLVSAIAAVCAAVMAIALLFARPDRVYLVNGTDEGYSLAVNGETVYLPAWGHHRVEVDYGDVLVEPDTSDRSRFEPFTVSIEASVFDRFGRQPVFVLNSDGEAVLVWDEVVYLEEEMNDDVNEDRLRFQFDFGDRFYRYERVDSAFSNLPETIYDGRPGERVYRSQLSALVGWPPSEIVQHLYGSGQIEDAVRYAMTAIERDPLNEVLLEYGTMIMDPDVAVPFLERGLEVRPMRVDWHRYYQENLLHLQSEDAVRDRYEELLKAEPDSPSLMYLLGRVTPDPEDALDLFRAASQHSSPSAHAFFAIAHHYSNRGRFRDALSNVRMARDIIPDNHQFLEMEEDLMLATGEIEELIDRALNRYNASYNMTEVLRLLFLFGTKEDAAASRNLVDNLLAELDSDEVTDQTVAIMQAAYEEGAGNLDNFAANCEKVDGPKYRYQAAVARRDLVKASTQIREMGLSHYAFWLLLYSVAERSGDSEAADSLLALAVSDLRAATPREKRIAGWFADGAEAPTLETFYAEARGSVVLLVALAYRHPLQRESYLLAARRLNFNPSFPGLVLSDLMREP